MIWFFFSLNLECSNSSIFFFLRERIEILIIRSKYLKFKRRWAFFFYNRVYFILAFINSMNRNSLLEKLGRLYAHCSPIVANSNTSHGGIAKIYFFIPRGIAERTIKFCAMFSHVICRIASIHVKWTILF